MARPIVKLSLNRFKVLGGWSLRVRLILFLIGGHSWLLISQQLESGARVSTLLILEQAVHLTPPSTIQDKRTKGRSVYQRLSRHAEQTQQRIRTMLEQGDVKYRSFYIVNAICAEVDEKMLLQLAALPEVVSIVPNTLFRLPDDRVDDSMFLARSLDLPWGLVMIEADKVWEMGFRGQGVLVGGHDTGIDWQHPALIENYRGWQSGQVDHNYSWHDAIHAIDPLHHDSIVTEFTNPCGLNTKAPCDDSGSSHGTHTLGTMVGNDASAGMVVGVAPEAEWIAVRNMERGFGTLASYLEGFEWFLAPTDLLGENPDPDKAPDIINNSWSCTTEEGCRPSNFAILETAIDHLRQSGIMVVASAGNAGALGCETITTPVAIYEGVLTVGSTDPNDSLSSFSSKGPVSIDESLRLKPDVTAPGRGVVSSMKGSRYGSLSGTSMAGPHVAGLAALLISANPLLAGQVEVIEEIIKKTAVRKMSNGDCDLPDGTTSEANYLYGYGRVNAFAAVNEALKFTTSTTESVRSNDWDMFPNPVSEVVTIQTDESWRHTWLVVYDLSGRKLLEMPYSPLENQLDVHHWLEGVYVISLRSPQGKVGYQLLQVMH